MTSSIFSRRRILRAAGIVSGLAASAAQGQPGAVQSGIDIEQSINISLASEDVFRFVSDVKIADFKGPAPTISGYVQIGPEKKVSSTSVTLHGAVERTYNIEKKNAGPHIPIRITVPVSEVVTLEVYSLIFVSTPDLTKRNLIEQAFSSYDPQLYPDPHAYAAPRLGPAGVTSDMFAIRQTWRLVRNQGARKEYVDAENAVRALYGLKPVIGETTPRERGRAITDSIVAKSPWEKDDGELGSMRSNFVKDDYSIKLLGERALDGLPTQVSRQPMTSARMPNLEQMIKDEVEIGLKAVDCEAGGPPVRHRLAVLFSYPEFKIDWVADRVKVGCVVVEYQRPVLKTRYQELVLFGYYNPIKNLQPVIEKALKDCLVFAFASGVIAGLVLSNFQAAITCFKLMFHECATKIPSGVVKCFIPGIALLLQSDGDWR